MRKPADAAFFATSRIFEGLAPSACGSSALPMFLSSAISVLNPTTIKRRMGKGRKRLLPMLPEDGHIIRSPPSSFTICAIYLRK